jgi:multidrug efflux pump
MKITSYFIKHPVTAIILNCMIIMVGILCLHHLKIREYPKVILPDLQVTASYPSASADLVESSVTNILEDQLAGIEGIKNITSSSQYGLSIINLDFHPNVSIDKALISARDAVGKARGMLPEIVKEPTINRAEDNSGPPFMAVCLESEALTFGELTHYTNLELKNSFRSIQGISSVSIYGQPYTYKIILDAHKLYNFGINADEVYNAIEKSGASLPAGKFQKELPVTIDSELKNIEDFENIVVKNIPKPVFLKSLATIELATDNQRMRLKINGKPGLCIGLQKTSDDNPVEVSALVHQKVAEIKQTIPDTIKIAVPLDQAEFIRSSISNIESSILEAIFLVLVIVFLFLRNVRATLVPIITIPISLIGSLIFLNLCGFSLNIMTLLAMVLAIGLVVDDAIIVLENISRHIENGESPLNAALKGAKEIGFAIIAMTLTLTSVYAPIAFITGVIGQLFIEFAAALAGSVLISGIVAITLSPLMCAHILKPKHEVIFPQIDLFLNKLSSQYLQYLKQTIAFKKTTLLFLTLVISVIIFTSGIIPQETAPSEDRGLIGVFVPAASGKNLDDIEQNIEKVENLIKNIPESIGSMTFMGEWGGQVILPLKPINERKRSADEIVNSLRPLMGSLKSIDAWPWSLSTSLPGTKNANENLELILNVSTTKSYQELFDMVNITRNVANEQKLFSSVDHNLKLDDLGLNINIDKNTLGKLNLSEYQVAKMIEIFFSGDTALDFKMDGILYSITIEGNKNPWSLDELYITNSNGKRISIASFASISSKSSPKSLDHANQMRSVEVRAKLTKGDNLEESMAKLYKLADETLPKSYKKTWSGVAQTFNETSTSTKILYLLSILFIYAILAVQFESFIDPFIILLTVPLACVGSLLTLYFTSGTLNIYSQVGIITLIGLITKHGILIVEFANQLHAKGSSLLDAILESTHVRLRPILMTTGAMICGIIPLILSTSAGSEARHAIGIILVSGLSFGTIFTLFILPNLYYMIKSLNTKNNNKN